MTDDELKQTAEAMMAYAKDRNTKIQYAMHGYDNWTPTTQEPSWNCEDYKYRIAPAPRMRDVRADELPPAGFAVRWPTQESEEVAIRKNNHGLSFANDLGLTCHISYATLRERGAVYHDPRDGAWHLSAKEQEK